MNFGHVEIDTGAYAISDGNGVLTLLCAGMGIGQHSRGIRQLSN